MSQIIMAEITVIMMTEIAVFQMLERKKQLCVQWVRYSDQLFAQCVSYSDLLCVQGVISIQIRKMKVISSAEKIEKWRKQDKDKIK